MTHWDRTKKTEINGNLKIYLKTFYVGEKIEGKWDVENDFGYVNRSNKNMSETTSVTSIGLIKINISVYNNHGTFYRTAPVLLYNMYIQNLLVSSHTTSSAGCLRFFSSVSVVLIIAQ